MPMFAVDRYQDLRIVKHPKYLTWQKLHVKAAYRRLTVEEKL